MIAAGSTPSTPHSTLLGIDNAPPSLATPAMHPSSVRASEALGAPREKADFRDLLTILVPMFAAAVVFLVSAAGMRRLESYDSEFSRAREERRSEAKDFREEVADLTKDLRGQIKISSDSLDLRLEKAVAEKFDAKWAEMPTKFERYKVSAEAELQDSVRALKAEIVEKVASFEARFGFMAGRGELVDFARGAQISVAQLEKDITRLFAKRTAADRQSAIAAVEVALADSTRLFGSENDWFNLSAELGRSDQEELALKVCQVALQSYKNDAPEGYQPNQDLLAHAIQFAALLGRWPQVTEWIATAESMGRDKWNWRLFTFIGDYLEDRNEAAFLQIMADFERVCPSDERQFSKTAAYWRKRGKPDLAEAAIKRGLEKSGIRGQQLWGLYSDILLSQGRYDEVISVTARALAATAVDQPGTSQYGVVFRRANAFDAKLFSESLWSSPELGGNLSSTDRATLSKCAQTAVDLYRFTLTFDGVNPLVELQCEQRIRIITAMCALCNIAVGEESPPRPRMTSARATVTTISQGQATQLADQIVDTIGTMEEADWEAIQVSLQEKLQSEFKDDALAALRDAILVKANGSRLPAQVAKRLHALLKALV